VDIKVFKIIAYRYHNEKFRIIAGIVDLKNGLEVA
jgi:hypothetical protein